MRWHHWLLFVMLTLTLTLALVALAGKLGVLGLAGALALSRLGGALGVKILVWVQPEVFLDLCRCKVCKRGRRMREIDAVLLGFCATLIADEREGTMEEKISRALSACGARISLDVPPENPLKAP